MKEILEEVTREFNGKEYITKLPVVSIIDLMRPLQEENNRLQFELNKKLAEEYDKTRSS